MMNKIKLVKLFTLLLTLIASIPLYSQEYRITFSAPVNESVFILPVPNLKIAINTKLSLHINDEKIASDFAVLNTWHNNQSSKFIRLLAIDISNHENLKQPPHSIKFSLKWVPAEKELPTNNIFTNTQTYLVYPSISWLGESVLLQPENHAIDNSWYTDPQTLYANFVTDETLLEQRGYPRTHQSQWLFDRVRAIFQLFILTNDDKWLKAGIKLSHFYTTNIDDSGSFLGNNFDLKFLMPNGLLYYYLLTGDKQIISVLKAFYEKSLSWDPTYDGGYKFWTERHQAAALNIAIAYWEVTGSIEAKNRIDDIIEATVQMVFNPREGWALRGCPQHTYKSHEGKAGDSPVCSPWMMALLSDGLWRYYRLSDDKNSAALLDAFGDFILNYGIHFADDRLKNMVLPLYLSSMDNILLQIKNQWTDGQHACDVAGLIGKSLYIKKKTTKDTFILQELFNVFVQQCKDINKKYRNKKHDYLPMLPPRRFGWTYSTTSDLPWLESWLNSHGTQ
ncbi:MAG: hypothetical protein V7736_12300 [Colwellia polaris]|jgi:hypothetical protein